MANPLSFAFGGNEGPAYLGGPTTSGPINVHNSELRSQLFGGKHGGGGGLNIRGPNYRSNVKEAAQSTSAGTSNTTILFIAAAIVGVMFIIKRNM